MKQHFSEADLLETYYMRPGESMPVMMHLADCADCAARYERLEKKMQSLRSCAHDEKPETFWARQRMSVMRRIESRRSPRMTRLAAAAVLVLALGGVVAWQTGVDSPAPRVVETPAPGPLDPAPKLEDSPWASEPLDEYAAIVDWETWVDNDGDQS